ncbi:MAG: chemotaxis protein CheW, partial [Leptospiraceae bacterium]|nr:chemotaxis protein CheW [Leptospiraceae bacterium]
PIVGLREKFNLDPIEQNEFTRIIVVNQNQKLIGMVVDEVNRVVNVPVENIEGNPDMVNDKTRSLVRGVAKLEDAVIILVELDYLLYALEEIQYEDNHH